MTDQNIYAAPVTDNVIQADDAEHKPLTLKQKLWGFQGRISRKGYWGYGVLVGLLFSIPFSIAYGIMLTSIFALSESGEPDISAFSTTAIICGIIMLLTAVPMTWHGYAVIIKRFHDRGKSGWWSLIALIPYVGGIWLFVECGCLAGDKGRNQYGDDPLLADGKTHDTL